MYRHSQNQLEFENFCLPFGGKLRSDNRWVKLAKFIPWGEFEISYSKSLKGSGFGPPAKSVRVALGALIIKERLRTSDEETVEQIRENPYLQYFLGFKEYKDEAPFHPTMFVHFRKRISKSMVFKINEAVNKKAVSKTQKASDDDSTPQNKGKLLVDATCAPADITFPTDLKLLNKAREKSEQIIDVLHLPHKGKMKKPRTYRKKARKDFLSVAKSKRLSKSKRRKSIRKQIGYVARNLKTIDLLSENSSLSLLDRRQYKDLLVINELLRQQKWMHEQHENRINDRIVSISQPHVRPIKRGKANASTEFGAKISASLVDGYCFLDHLDWNNYNESGDLVGQIEAYKERFGFYPSSVHADRIYRNRNNIKYCKKHGIRLSGPRLGCPPKQLSKKRDQQKQSWQDEIDRIPIEGKFGQAKRRFGLSRIMSKIAQTSEKAIAIIFLVMNLEKWLKVMPFYFFCFLNWILWGLFYPTRKQNTCYITSDHCR
ncbi:IS5 family transposase [Desulfobacula sp.]|uniref:IS5 family transposase n=1 Tax=Desulfobacula sp. TaxID=2593537 RepID=UPI0026092976|nr:IS5 family transposase [Desulfobacula sp.]